MGPRRRVSSECNNAVLGMIVVVIGDGSLVMCAVFSRGGLGRLCYSKSVLFDWDSC